LKCEQPYFEDMSEGLKTFEVRRDDRDFSKGDLLHLREWNAALTRGYTGRSCIRTVSYVLLGGAFGIETGFVVLGLDQPSPPEHQAEGREKQLEEALRECIQFAIEGWAYASPYFCEKWDYEGELAKFRTALEGDER